MTTKLKTAKIRLRLLVALFLISAPEVPAQSVEIVRDNYWVPHIIGDTPREVAYGLAIAMSQDHPKVVIDNILYMRGELASAYGPAFLDKDKKARALRLHQTAASTIQQALPQVIDFSEGFAEGINFYFADHPERLPVEVAAIDFFPVTTVDASALGYLKMLTQEWGRFQQEAGSLLGGNSIQDMSNMWTVAPGRSRDGAGYLLCDPHLPFDGLTATWEAHLLSRDGILDFEGGFFEGTPSPMMGHNRHLAWAHTSNTVDFADAYIVTLDANNPEHYLLDGQSKPFTVWSETIPVAGAAPLTVKFRSSPDHGVWVKKLNDRQALFAKLEMEGQPPLTEQGLRMMAATSVADFDAIMALHQYDKWNTIALDDQGNMLYIYNGRTHWRTNPSVARSGPLDGATSTTLWGALIPFAQLPRIANPASGFLQNCNDAPWYVTDTPGFGRDDVPIELYRGDHFGERGRRATELLNLGGDTLSAAYLENVALDTKMTSWDSISVVLQTALQESAVDSFARQAEAEQLADRLFNWHGFARTDSPEMTLLWMWRRQVPRQIDFFKPGEIDAGGRRELVTGLVNAGDALMAQYGSLEVPWGEVHGFSRNGVWYPVSGGYAPDFPSARLGNGSQIDAQGRFITTGGNDFLMLIRLKPGESPQAWTMKPYGQSADPASPHYADLTVLYSADSLRKTFYEEADFRANAVRTETFIVTSVEQQGDGGTAVPDEISLYPNYPNPFNPSTVITFQLPEFSEIELSVHDILGRRIAVLQQGKFAAGVHEVRWQPGASAPSGTYFLRLKAENGLVQMRKVLFLK